MKGGDHSNGGALIGAELKAAGYTGIIRYACAGRDDVNITTTEVRDLQARGIEIGIVNEHQADYLLGGYAVGKQRALEARTITRAVGLPDGVVYMAADFDATLGGSTSPGSPGDRNMQKIANALRGAADGIGPENVGFYGSYFAMVWLLAHESWIRWYWQTLAWSHGWVHPRRNVYQYASSHLVGGIDVDLDDMATPDWGQRSATAPTPTPHPIAGDDMISICLDKHKNLNIVVEKAGSGEVFHAYQKTDTDLWDGSKPGQPGPTWHSLGTPGKP